MPESSTIIIINIIAHCNKPLVYSLENLHAQPLTTPLHLISIGNPEYIEMATCRELALWRGLTFNLSKTLLALCGDTVIIP